MDPMSSTHGTTSPADRGERGENTGRGGAAVRAIGEWLRALESHVNHTTVEELRGEIAALKEAGRANSQDTGVPK